ncbi:MAG: methyltransferase domain-containing protein [Chitinophagaceae bacterium]|nr:methyltransferase domain-containing protein [Chitinophagaceae bacterium]
MKQANLPLQDEDGLSPLTPVTSQNSYQAIRDYYDIAGPDYAMWSRHFNMHFGYVKTFTDIFRLEKMLQQMNDVVLDELAIDTGSPALLADLGCGMGTVARHVAKRFPYARITGVTIVDSQLNKGRELITKEQLESQVDLVKDNFEHLQFADNSFTHAYAVESACHASGNGKQFFVQQLARILRPGGRFCIADGFLKKADKRPRLFEFLHQKISRYWALPGFAQLTEMVRQLELNGMKNIRIREISWRIAPSVAYVPFTCLKFFLHELWKRRSLRMEKERWHNVYGPVLGMIMGMFRRQFGYYIISGEKAGC